MRHNILDIGVRKTILNEILGEENQRRKEESLRRFEVYKQNQRRFVMAALAQEFSPKTVSTMRTLTSINLTKRVVDQKASIYREPPLRIFTKGNKQELSPQELQEVTNCYHLGNFNVSFKNANRLFKLQSDQIHLQVVIQGGVPIMRVLMPHHLDVIPSIDNPEKGEVFITSVMDRQRLMMNSYSDIQSINLGNRDQYRDLTDQKIADPDDQEKLSQMRFTWWSDEWNFITNGLGEIVDEMNYPLQTANEEDVRNPIGIAPFVDVSTAKDYEYWVRSGSNIVDFSIEMGVMLSDLANTMRLNGHIQGVVYAEKVPGSIAIGPNKWIHIPINPDATIQPSVEMLSPSSQIQQQMDTLQTLIQLMIAQEGLDAKSIAGMGGGQTYSSAIERLLALIERFEASRDDIDSFTLAETRVFEIMKAWINLYFRAEDDSMNPILNDKINISRIPEDAELQVQYGKPEEMLTEQQRVDVAIKQLQEGVMSQTEAIAYIRDIPMEQAEKVAEEINEFLPEATGV